MQATKKEEKHTPHEEQSNSQHVVPRFEPPIERTVPPLDARAIFHSRASGKAEFIDNFGEGEVLDYE